MNNFADALLGLLLSWMRTFINNIWSVLSGGGSGLLDMIGRYWLVVAAALLLCGVLADTLVYILRWRPHYVWRTHFQGLFYGGRAKREDAQFSQGYAQGVENIHFQDSVSAFLQQPRQESISPEMMSYYNAAPSNAGESIDIRQLPGGDQLPVERRRRSGRHHKRVYLTEKLRLRLPSLSDEQPAALYPAPPIRAREAFHAPVYPADHLRRQPDDKQGGDGGNA